MVFTQGPVGIEDDTGSFCYCPQQRICSYWEEHLYLTLVKESDIAVFEGYGVNSEI